MAEIKEPKEIVFTPSEFEQVSKYLIGSQIRPYPNVIVPQSNGHAYVQSKEELIVHFMTNHHKEVYVWSLLLVSEKKSFIEMFVLKPAVI